MDGHIHISPSLMTMDLDQFREQISFLDSRVDSFHIDIMDGHFVPNISLSPWFIQEARKLTDREMSAHLMVTAPAFWVQQLIDVRCDVICFHAENTNGMAFRLIEQIHKAGLKAGAVLNPETPVSVLLPYLEQLDKVTVMTVDPGFAGQSFQVKMLDKIRELKQMRDENPAYHYLTEMDGSTNKAHWKVIYEAGPDVYIIGRSGLFGLTDNIEASWRQMTGEFEEATGRKFT